MKYVKLNNVCEINIGKTPSRYNNSYWDDGEYSWISIADMKNKYIGETKEKISSVAVKECNMKVIPKDTLIMSFKLSLGKLARTKEDMYSNEAIANFPIIDKSKLYINYLYYALQTLNLSQSSDRAVMGATLNKAKLNEIQIPLPPLDIQKKIADVLDKTQELIDKRKEQISALDKFLENLFLDMFGDPVSNSMGWEKVEVIDVCKEIVDCVNKTAPLSEVKTEYKMLRTTNIKNGKINYEQVDYVDEETFKKWTRRLIPEVGDVLLTREAPMGQCGLLDKKDQVFIGQRIMHYRPNGEKINGYYLLYQFIAKDVQRQLDKLSVGSTVKHLSVIECKKIKIYVPPLDLQNQFASIVEKVEEEKTKLEASLKDMEDNFNSIMQRAFKGELF